ncbi:MAG: monovalent cation:H+ antiporter, family [Patescibacteria group bacterium]|nr:monovalent cation:H+ antiporter, family [Patescibacteria group bacterium]
MSSFFLSTLSLVLLLVIAAGVSYWAGRSKIPATVALVTAGMTIALVTKFGFAGFLDDFELTPEMLFYVFLPILLFESAYNVRYKELLRNIRSISLLSVVSLIISAFFIAFGMRYGLLLFGIDVPLEVTLLFGALISATDTAAVLAVFKELGVPRRLNLIFEGESLFNDGTAIALFLVVLGIVESQASSGVPTNGHSSMFETFFVHGHSFFGSAYPVFKGLASFASMLGVGILL